MGENQDWAMIKIIDSDFSANKYHNEIVYTKIYDILTIKDPSTSIPVFNVGEITTLLEAPDSSYIVGKWYKRTEKNPFYNRKTQQYMISILTDSMVIPASDGERELLKRKGLELLCDYYAKRYDNNSIDTMLGYYKFVEIVDFHVPIRPNQKTKCLVALHAKYFNPIPQKNEDPIISSLLSGFDSSDQVTGNRTVVLNTSKISKQVKKISRKMQAYQNILQD